MSNNIDPLFIQSRKTHQPAPKTDLKKKPEAGAAGPELAKDEVRVGSTGAWGPDGSDKKVDSSTSKAESTPKAKATPQKDAGKTPAPATPGFVIPKTATSGMGANGVITMIEENTTNSEVQRFEAAEADLHKPKKSGWDKAVKYGGAAAFATLSLVGIATNTAQAQTVSTVANQQLTRTTAPVQVSSPQDAVDNFSAENQLYVIGRPMMDGEPVDLSAMSDALKEHPNIYVVINGDTTRDHTRDEEIVGRGIGNHSEFMEVREQRTGERNGVVFLINLDAKSHEKGRVTMMRSEGLPDQLGVGDGRGGNGHDAWFPNGRPGDLGQQFVNAYKQGKGLGRSMEVVFDSINSRINSHVDGLVTNATSDVNQARSALGGAETAATSFQREHGSGGELGSPNVDGWKSSVRQAQEALNQGDFATASQLSSGVTSEMRAYEQSVATYNQAPEIAAQVRSTLSELQGQLDGLPENSHADKAAASLRTARGHLERFQSSYEAKNTDFSTHLQAARDAASSGVSSAQQSRDSAAMAKNLKIGGAAAITVAVLAAGIISNRRASGASKKAEGELKEATSQIADKSQALLSLMEKADFNTMAGFEGETKKLADQVMDQTLTALTLVGGAEKFLAEAETLINAKGIAGKVKNMFATGNYKSALDLLTLKEGGKAVKFDTSDSTRAAMEEGSKAQSWRDGILGAGESRQFEATLREVLLQMGENYDSAKKVHEEIEFKNDRVNVFLGEVDGQAKKSEAQAKALQTAGQNDGFFTAPSITNHLLRTVLAGEQDGGLLAKGTTIAKTDPVQAWDDYGTVAKRMTEDADETIGLGKEARETLLPTIAKADSTLPENGVKTDWAHKEKTALSNNLDELAVTATRTDISKDLQGLRKKTHVLNSRVNTVMEQDTVRREISPKEIKSAKDDVAKTRQEVFDALQASGAFRNGSPDGILREPDRDPSTRTKDADENLAAVPVVLSEGNIEQAGTHIQNIKDLTADAHRLAKETRQALKAYPETLSERQTRHTNIGKSIPETYTPSMKRIKDTYVPKVMTQVAADVGAGDTLADNITTAEKLLVKGNNSTLDAVKNYDKAQLLTSRDELNETDETLKQAQAQLTSVTDAEALLAKKQQGAEAELGQLKGRLRSTQSNAGQHFVRSKALTLYSDAQKQLKTAEGTVKQAVKSPYDANQQLSVAENLRSQSETAIANDKAAYNSAVSSIDTAGSSISSASSKISQADSWSDSTHVSGYGSVSTSTGSLSTEKGELRSARSLRNQAQAALDAQDYEEAARLAQRADSKADDAYRGAASEISSAESEHSSKVSSARSEVRRREAEERRQREAAERRRRESSSSSSSGGWSSSSSSGGSSGGW